MTARKRRVLKLESALGCSAVTSSPVSPQIDLGMDMNSVRIEAPNAEESRSVCEGYIRARCAELRLEDHYGNMIIDCPPYWRRSKRAVCELCWTLSERRLIIKDSIRDLLKLFVHGRGWVWGARACYVYGDDRLGLRLAAFNRNRGLQFRLATVPHIVMR